MQMMRGAAVFAMVFLSAAGVFTGCIKAPAAEPVAYYSEAQLRRMGLTVVQLDAVLEDQNGNGIGGVIVSVETSHYRELSQTSNSGYFFAKAKFQEMEGIDFHFTSPHIEWTETVTDIPKGVEKITLHFTLNPNKTVRLAALEY